MKKTWIVLAMAAALCAACDDSKDDAKCIENATICDNGQRMVCTHGTYVAVDCPSKTTCQNGACVTPAVQECLNGTLATAQCFGTTAIQYCNNGQISVEQCPSGYLCAKNASGAAYCAKDTSATTGACDLGSVRCSSSKVRQLCKLADDGSVKWEDFECKSEEGGPALHCFQGDCVECESGDTKCEKAKEDTKVNAMHCNNGKWETTATCDSSLNFVCRKGVCYDANACDTPDALRCGEGEIIQTCQNNTWKTTGVCTDGKRCFEGECVDGVVPGDTCDEDTFEMSCIGNSIIYCEEGVVGTMKCGKATCASAPYSYVDDKTGKTINAVATDCYDENDECDPEQSNYSSCFSYSIYGYIQSADECLLADNRKYYKVPMNIEKQCPNGCDGDVCKEGGTPATDGDDIAYDCSNESYDGKGTTLAQYCKNNGGGNFALCIPCAQDSFFCDGAVGDHMGTNYCDSTSGGGDDTLYDCSSSAYDDKGTTLAQYCQTNKGVNSALCIPCSQKNFFCADASYIGQKAGTSYCDSSEGYPIFDCTNEKLQSGVTLGADCAADDPTMTMALCVDCTNSYFCATPAEAQQYIGADGTTLCQ